MTEIIVVCHEDVKKIGINLAYKLFRLIVVIKDQTCLPDSGKTYMYIRTSDKLVCPSRTRKKKIDETIVAISSHACLTDAILGGFLPSPYNTTSLSFTALTRTSVSSAVNRSWRAPGKYAIIIAIHNGTCAPAFKGNVGWRSDWFISRYAQTTPMNNEATSDQPILDLRRAQEPFIPPGK